MIRVKLVKPPEGSSSTKCGLCAFATGSIQDLDRHVKGSHGGNIVMLGEDAHIEIPLHKCSKCKFTTRDPATLEEHERNDHSGKRRVLLKNRRCKSKVDPKVTKIAGRLDECDQHNNENELLKCDMCYFVTKWQELFKSHSEGHNKCNKCDFVGSDRMDLRAHILARHREKGMLLTEYTT